MIMKKLLLIFIALLLSIVTYAEKVEINGVYYNLISKLKEADVTKKNNGYYEGDIVIPASVMYNGIEYNVIKIEEEAFSDCKNLTSISIPKTITEMGKSAFWGCSKLTVVCIEDVASWCNITFNHTAGYSTNYSNPLSIARHLYMNGTEIRDLVIPDGVTIIKEEVFSDYDGLESVIIPNSVISIEYGAFSFCDGLTSINIPNSVVSIGVGAFENCSKLMFVNIPNSVTSIGAASFWACSNLTSVNIPNSVTIIENQTFGYCSKLASITIPNSITKVEWNAFYNCSSLTDIYISDISSWCNISFDNPIDHAHHLYLGDNEIKDLSIPNSVTGIGNYAFSNCSGLTSVTISNNVASIGTSAFSGCSSLTSVTIGSGLEEIKEQAFASCVDLMGVYCYSESVPIANNNSFEGSYIEYATLYVPASSIDSYTNTEPWKNFKNIIPLGNYYDFTINVGNNGKVNYDSQTITGSSNTFYVGEGSNAELTITPDENYQIATLTVNGVDAMAQLNNGVLTISNITANTTVAVTFEAIPALFETIKMAVASGNRTAIGYSSANGLDFTNVTDVKAWIVSGFTADATVLLSRVKIVPPNTGLYLTSDVAGVEVVVPKTNLDVYYANLLLAAVTEETIDPTEVHDGVEYTNFVVGKLNSGEMGFVRVKNTRTLGPNKSRLLVPSSYYPVSNQAPELQVTFTEDASTTDLRSIDVTQQSDSHVYDLQGRKLSLGQAQKGIYIYKGKKYVIK
jgi:hypothetical protein